jgi:hypothetical protein
MPILGKWMAVFASFLMRAGLGERKPALKWLEHSHEERNPLLVYLADRCVGFLADGLTAERSTSMAGFSRATPGTPGAISCQF